MRRVMIPSHRIDRHDITFAYTHAVTSRFPLPCPKARYEQDDPPTCNFPTCSFGSLDQWASPPLPCLSRVGVPRTSGQRSRLTFPFDPRERNDSSEPQRTRVLGWELHSAEIKKRQSQRLLLLLHSYLPICPRPGKEATSNIASSDRLEKAKLPSVTDVIFHLFTTWILWTLMGTGTSWEQ